MTVSWIVWGAWFALFVVLEIPAVLGLTPWTSLSRTVWNLQVRFPWVGPAILGGLAVLAYHIVRPQSVQEGDEKKEPHEKPR